jgi:hypothetical protein
MSVLPLEVSDLLHPVLLRRFCYTAVCAASGSVYPTAVYNAT